MSGHSATDQCQQVATALLISKHESDHFYFKGLFNRTNWKLHHARNTAQAIELFQQHSIPVVIVDEAFDEVTWNILFQALRQGSWMPKLLIASLLNSGDLWAEMLDSGGYDILARPLDQQEVLHSISMAWLAWKCEQDAGARVEPAAIFPRADK